MSFATKGKEVAGKALSSVHAGDDKLASRTIVGGVRATLKVSSPAFASDGPLPVSATADGEGKCPPIDWDEVPGATKSLVVICEDPDAPFPKPFVHWLVYGLAPTAHQVGGAFREGKNSTLKNGFTGAAPPPGHGTHHYHFQVFALDTPIDAAAGLGRSGLLGMMRGHILAWGETVGTYERSTGDGASNGAACPA